MKTLWNGEPTVRVRNVQAWVTKPSLSPMRWYIDGETGEPTIPLESLPHYFSHEDSYWFCAIFIKTPEMDKNTFEGNSVLVKATLNPLHTKEAAVNKAIKKAQEICNHLAGLEEKKQLSFNWG